ncbi:atrial natriuretic peptide receptor 3, partial [Biomphalaria pfeifferi]
MTAFHKLKRIVIMLPSLVALLMVSTSKAAKVLEPVMISALLPHAKHYQFTHQKIAPAIEIAIDKVKAPGGPLHGHNVTILYGNSECSSSHSMNEAINLFVNKKTHIFLGPTCAYAVAPLVRQA